MVENNNNNCLLGRVLILGGARDERGCGRLDLLNLYGPMGTPSHLMNMEVQLTQTRREGKEKEKEKVKEQCGQRCPA